VKSRLAGHYRKDLKKGGGKTVGRRTNRKKIFEVERIKTLRVTGRARRVLG